MEISLEGMAATLVRCRLPSSACHAGEPCRLFDAHRLLADPDGRVSGFPPAVETDQREAAAAVSRRYLAQRHAAGAHLASGRWQVRSVEGRNRQQALARR